MARTQPSATSLDLVSLRLLLAVISEGNLARAAARENIAVSAASRRISNLEIRLGTKLLRRHDRGIEPTAAASLAVPRIEAVFEMLDRLVEELSDVRDGVRGQVRVQAHTTAIAGVIPERLVAFSRLHPGIEVTIEESTSVDIRHAVASGTCDIGLVAGTAQARDVALIPWSSDRLVAVLPPDSPLTAAETVRMVDLLDYPFVAMQRDSALTAMFREKATMLGVVMDERAHLASFDAACRLVSMGMGVTIVPSVPGHRAASSWSVAIRALDEDWAERPLMICARPREKISAAARLLIDFLCEQ